MLALGGGTAAIASARAALQRKCAPGPTYRLKEVGFAVDSAQANKPRWDGDNVGGAHLDVLLGERHRLGELEQRVHDHVAPRLQEHGASVLCAKPHKTRADADDFHGAVADDVVRDAESSNRRVHTLEQVPARGQHADVAAVPLCQGDLTLSTKGAHHHRSVAVWARSRNPARRTLRTRCVFAIRYGHPMTLAVASSTPTVLQHAAPDGMGCWRNNAESSGVR